MPQPPDRDPSLSALEIRGPATGLLDDRLALHARGAGPDEDLLWRARYRDDDDRVWRASAERADGLTDGWAPAKGGTGPVAALGSLRPVRIDVRVQAQDGRTASRTLTRRILDDGVRVRRWRDDVAATLHLPAQPVPCATVLIDATAGPPQAVVAALAAALLASRGALVLAVAGGPPASARERLGAVPSAMADIEELEALAPTDAPRDGAVVLPPGVGARDGVAAERAKAWDALLERLGARPR